MVYNPDNAGKKAFLSPFYWLGPEVWGGHMICLLPPNQMGRNQGVNPSLSDAKALYPTLCCFGSNAYFSLPTEPFTISKTTLDSPPLPHSQTHALSPTSPSPFITQHDVVSNLCIFLPWIRSSLPKSPLTYEAQRWTPVFRSRLMSWPKQNLQGFISRFDEESELTGAWFRMDSWALLTAATQSQPVMGAHSAKAPRVWTPASAKPSLLFLHLTGLLVWTSVQNFLTSDFNSIRHTPTELGTSASCRGAQLTRHYSSPHCFD